MPADTSKLKEKAWKTRNAETNKSRLRRLEEGWFEKYAPAELGGIDIGCGNDSLHPNFRKYDKKFGDGDAQKMADVEDNSYHSCYVSHVLEHMHNPVEAIRNWYRICKPGGHVIICVPHRDLYEKKTKLPSRWNGDHKSFWLPERAEEPHTRSFRQTIKAGAPQGKIVLLRVLDQGFVSNGPTKHSDGEYSIEAIIHKPLSQ